MPSCARRQRDGVADATVGAGDYGGFHLAVCCLFALLTGVPEISESGGFTISGSSRAQAGQHLQRVAEIAADRDRNQFRFAVAHHGGANAFGAEQHRGDRNRERVRRRSRDTSDEPRRTRREATRRWDYRHPLRPAACATPDRSSWNCARWFRESAARKFVQRERGGGAVSAPPARSPRAR